MSSYFICVISNVSGYSQLKSAANTKHETDGEIFAFALLNDGFFLSYIANLQFLTQWNDESLRCISNSRLTGIHRWRAYHTTTPPRLYYNYDQGLITSSSNVSAPNVERQADLCNSLPIHLTKATLCGLDWVAVLDSFYPGRHISNQISTCMQTGQYNS